MYSILPAFVSALFIGCGFYAISIREINRVSLSFFFLCLTTACWQGTWALLFQTQQIELAHLLVKMGYLLILFLPTSFYLFLVEVCNKGDEKRYVMLSFGIAAVLAVSLLSSDLFVSGQYKYFFGYYPKAGMLHPVHVAQTVMLAARCFVITYRAMEKNAGRKRAQLKLCLLGLGIYTFSAIDYLCNYGVEFYPPGVVFLTASFIFFTVAIMRYDLMNPFALIEVIVASINHEMRNPFNIFKTSAKIIAADFPTLCETYRLAILHGLHPDTIAPFSFELISAMPDHMGYAVKQATVTIDMFLTATRKVDHDTFGHYAIRQCVTDALEKFPFNEHERELVRYRQQTDFQFHGASDLLAFVLFNLLRNSLSAIESSQKGAITISTYQSSTCNVLEFTDTASGIDPAVLPYIFEAFFSTKRQSGGTGIGLSFCRQVLKMFGGEMHCRSELGVYTSFFLEFSQPRRS